MNLMQDPRPGEKFWSALISVAPYLDRDVNTFRSRVDWNLSDYLALDYVAGYSDFKGSARLRPVRRRHGAHQLHHAAPRCRKTAPTGRTTRTGATSWSCSRAARTTSTGSWACTTRPRTTASASTSRSPTARSRARSAGRARSSSPRKPWRPRPCSARRRGTSADSLHLTGGARFTWDDRKNEGGINWGWGGSRRPRQPIDPGTNPRDAGLGLQRRPQRRPLHRHQGHLARRARTGTCRRTSWSTPACPPATSRAACRTAACTTARRR